MLNPVVSAANLFRQIIDNCPISVQALYWLVMGLCTFFFILHIWLGTMK